MTVVPAVNEYCRNYPVREHSKTAKTKPRVETHSKKRARIVRRYHPPQSKQAPNSGRDSNIVLARSLVCVTQHYAVNKVNTTQIHTPSKTKRNCFFKLVLSSKQKKVMFCTIQCTHTHRVIVLLRAHKYKEKILHKQYECFDRTCCDTPFESLFARPLTFKLQRIHPIETSAHTHPHVDPTIPRI